MANTDWAFGFAPWRNVKSTNIYAITTAPTISIYHQAIVAISGTYDLTPHHGYLQSIAATAVIDGLDNILGTVLAVFDENMDPVKYILAAAAGDGAIAGYVLVADDPHQLYVAREDFTTNAIDTADAASNTDIVDVALGVGNTKTGISRQMLASNLIATTAALQVKVLYPHPNDVLLVADDTPGTSGDEGARWICQMNQHYLNQSAAVTGGVAA